MDVVITFALGRLPLDFWYSSMLLVKAWIMTAEVMNLSRLPVHILTHTQTLLHPLTAMVLEGTAALA